MALARRCYAKFVDGGAKPKPTTGTVKPTLEAQKGADKPCCS
jgi:hypothetical protein